MCVHTIRTVISSNISSFNFLRFILLPIFLIQIINHLLILNFANHYSIFAENENFIFVYNLIKSIIIAEDYERIKELRHWMLENITVARPITPFITIQAKNQKLNLRCEVICKNSI